MSTSDAGELELRVVGGETATPLYGTARPTRTTAREQQDETFGEKFKHKNHHSDETATGQPRHPAAIRQGETREELILTADRLKKEEASHCDGSNIQTQKPVGPRYSSCLFLRLSRNLGLEDPELGLEKKIESCVHSTASLTEIQRAEAKNNSCQVNGQRSPLDTSIKVVSNSALSERIPAKKKEEVITVLHNELETTRDLSVTHSFSSGESGPHECNGLHIFSFGSQTNILASRHTSSSSQTPKFTNTVSSTPQSFERGYGSVSKPFHPKTAFSLSPPPNAVSKTNYSSESIASTSSSFTICSHPAATIALSPSLLTPPITSAIASSPTITISSILTPPATPIITSPNYSDLSSTKEGGAFSNIQERDPKKLRPCLEGKRVRRVTWGDSVDLQCSVPITAEKPEPSPASTSSPSPSPRSIKAPSIFSFLRSSSPSANASPLCSPSPKTSSIQVVKGGKYRSLSSDSADLASRGRESPKMNQFDFYTDNEAEYKPSNQFLSCRDPSPGRSPTSSAAYATQFRKSTPSPRSPFSPFSSLSPLSSFPSPDVTDDGVFYSPKLQRRRESPSPCEPAEGISLGGSRRSRASTGPPSVGPRQDKECSASSYADLKYGIEPGRSFSVSSVLSSRPSGPGRISTGSRFMSVGDLSESALTCGGAGKDLDPWSVTPGWSTEYDCQPTKDSRVPYFPSDP
ncbi:hypothetical protein L3Q82_017994, partial [Scortum barcoo]